MARLRERILALGGIQAANSYVKINLSLFDLYPREHCPSIPPEMMLLPGNLLYQMSSWTRAIVMPLSIVHALNPRRPVPAGFTWRSCSCPGVAARLPAERQDFLSWRNFFLSLDRVLKLWERDGSEELRGRAPSGAAEQWMLERTQALRRPGRDLSADDVRRSWRSTCSATRRTIRIASRRRSSSTT